MKGGFAFGIIAAVIVALVTSTAWAPINPPYFGGYATHTITNGVLFSPVGTVIGWVPLDTRPGFSGTVAVESWVQLGGTHMVDGPLTMRGYVYTCFSCSGESFNALYRLSGGRLESGGIKMTTAAFTQSEGTNRVRGDLVIYPRWYDDTTAYNLIAGKLVTSNTIAYLDFARAVPAFAQSGGVYIIRGLLDLRSEYGRAALAFHLSGGELLVHDIAISGGAAFSHTGGTIKHSGTLLLAGGYWQAAPGAQRLGPMLLRNSFLSWNRTNSSLALPQGSSARLRFAASAGTYWEPGARLVIHGWTGSTNGRGIHQIYFGTNRAGLTPEQLSRISFRNPARFAPGDYPARIRGSGEIVPAGRPSLDFARTAGAVVMQWPTGYVLQSSTNVLGPFTDIYAASPYTLQIEREPARYFRLRQ